jgi:hypothetical protein
VFVNLQRYGRQQLLRGEFSLVFPGIADLRPDLVRGSFIVAKVLGF